MEALLSYVVLEETETLGLIVSVSDWLMLVGIAVSAGTLIAVGFGAVWLQHRLEDLRLKRDVFRRVVGNVHSVLYDCQVFGGSHSFSESGIIAVNEVRAVFSEPEVLEAWHNWYLKGEDSSEGNPLFVELIRAMSIACKLKQYQFLELEEIADAFACSCIPSEE